MRGCFAGNYHLLRTIPPRGFEQQVSEAESRILRVWLRALGAKWFGARGFLSFA